MTKRFKKGDRVRLITNELTPFPEGSVGTILNLDLGGYDYKVCFDNWEDYDYPFAFVDDYELEFSAVPGEDAVENRATSTSGGEKGRKLEEYALLPVAPLAEVAKLYGVGAQKYADRNWERGYPYSWSYSALMRHLQAFWSGEDKDPESGCHHLAAVVFHAFAMMQFQKTHPEHDDRSVEER